MEINLITEEECRKVVQNSELGKSGLPYKVLSYNTQLYGNDVLGFLGEYFRLTVQIEQNAKVATLTYFVKSMPRSNPDSCKIIEEGGMFMKEVKIYEEIFSQWPQTGDQFGEAFKWRPECYYTSRDIIVLEELNSEYRHRDGRREFDMRHCEETLKALSKMHACSLNYERRGEKLDTLFGHLFFDCPLAEGNQWFAAGLQLIHYVASTYSSHFKEIAIPAKDIFMDKLNKIFHYRDEVTDFEKVFCHRDVWYSNVFFKYSPEDLKADNPEQGILIDFQIADYKSPVMDVLIAIYTTTRRKFREVALEECCTFYLNYIENILRATFNYSNEDIDALKFLRKSEFERLRKHYQLFALVLTAIFVPLTHLKPGTLTKIQRADPQRYFKICNLTRNEFTRDSMEQDPFYKDYVLEVVGELLEFLFGKKE